MIPSAMLGHLRCRHLHVLTGPFVCFFLRMFNLTPSYHTMHAPCCPRPHPGLAIVEQVSSKRTCRCRSSFRGLTYCTVQYSSTVYLNMLRCHESGLVSSRLVYSCFMRTDDTCTCHGNASKHFNAKGREGKRGGKPEWKGKWKKKTKKPGLW